uniref:Uncharacterized protein n=1 Tax=Arundo donax TaxID=35708 RepID=A0A0A9A377_ARUDO
MWRLWKYGDSDDKDGSFDELDESNSLSG